MLDGGIFKTLNRVWFYHLAPLVYVCWKWLYVPKIRLTPSASPTISPTSSSWSAVEAGFVAVEPFKIFIIENIFYIFIFKAILKLLQHEKLIKFDWFETVGMMCILFMVSP